MPNKQKLTKSVIDKAAPLQKTYVLRDAEISGFSLRIYPSGRKAFFFRYRVGGGRGGQIREPRIGDFGELTPAEARNIALDWAASVRRGGDPMAERTKQRQSPIMSDLFDKYLSDHAQRHKKPASLINDTRMIEKSLRPIFGSKRVLSVSRQDIRAYHAGLEATPYEANRRLALLSKMFSFAADELEWIARGDHPVRGIKRFKETKRRRYLSQAELARLGETLVRAESGELGRSFSPYAIAAIRLLALTGARHDEILSLRWKNVNFERACLELPDSKTGEKDIFLAPSAMQLLSELPREEENPYVIVGQKAGSHLVNIKDSWNAIRQAASIEDVRLHDLRHSYASVAAGTGMSLPVIGALLGHTETATTARYAHLSTDPLRTAADRIGEEISTSMGSHLNGRS